MAIITGSAALLVILQALAQPLAENGINRLFSFMSDHSHEFRDIRQDFDWIKGELESMKAFLDRVDFMEGSAKNEACKEIVVFADQLRNPAYKLEDTIDEIKDFVHRFNKGGLLGHAHNARAAMHLSRDSFAAHPIAKKLKQVRDEIKEVSERRKRFDTPCPIVVSAGTISGAESGNFHPRFFDETENIVGIEGNERSTVDWLTNEETNLTQVSILGMGGLGKTTLATRIYNHSKIKSHFEFRAWVPVSQSWDLSELLTCIANDLYNDKAEKTNYASEQNLSRLIHGRLASKRYLIVLDDVWKNDVLNQILPILPKNNLRSRVLLTSRDHDLNLKLPTKSLELKTLKEDEAQGLFFKVVFGTSHCPNEKNYLANLGKEIVRKCGGLPLGIVTIGRLMASQGATLREWERICNCLQWELANNEKLEAIQMPLMFSYYKLPDNLKRCFLYCALFPEDYVIKTKVLIHCWIAEGFIEEEGGKTFEERGEEYVKKLVNRSMLQVVKRSETGKPNACKVHDLMRELALAESKNENFYMGKDGQIGRKEPFRRLSISERTKGRFSRNNSDFEGLRTLFVFKGNLVLAQSLSTLYPRLKLLRVLNLKGLPIDKVPHEIFRLFNLRFLSLRETKISEMPSSLEDLYNLQTLDLWKTNVKNLPREVLKLINLRHLFIPELDAHKLKYHNIGNIRGSNAPMNIEALKQLQTLRNIKADNETLAHLESMTQLKSLSITHLDEKTEIRICKSVSKMRGLIRLSVKARENGALALGNIDPPPSHLEKLILNGQLATNPRWFNSLHSLTQLVLIGSGLSDGTTLVAIQALQNLARLFLDDAYESALLCFPIKSFPNLKTLFLANMSKLRRVVIEKSAMPKLGRFYVSVCPNLHEIEGLELLVKLHDLKLKMLPRLDRSKLFRIAA